MIDIGWSELLVIGIVALIVVGPKDLPIMFRRMGEFTGKARAMAREFTSAMDRAADDAGVKDIQTDLRNIANPGKMGLDAINKAADDLAAHDPDQDTASPTKPAGPKGPATQKLSEERAAAARKIHEQSAQRAQDRGARDATAPAPTGPTAPAPADTASAPDPASTAPGTDTP